MLADPAETVRTLTAGHRPATVQVAWSNNTWTVPSAVDDQGRPLLLTADSGELAEALRPNNGLDTSVALRFDDEPPLPCAPTLGSAWICGFAEPVAADRQRDAAVTFAEANPLPELLDVGDGFSLWRVSVEEVRLENASGLTEISPDAYGCASADPWYPIELELLLDLYDHHPQVLAALTHRVQHFLPQARQVDPLRMNRHGVVVNVHCDDDVEARRFLIRHRPGVTHLSQVLHSLACCGCATETAA